MHNIAVDEYDLRENLVGGPLWLESAAFVSTNAISLIPCWNNTQHTYPMTMQLYVWSPALDAPSIDPKCIVVEAYLRLLEVNFTIVYANDPQCSPTGENEITRLWVPSLYYEMTRRVATTQGRYNMGGRSGSYPSSLGETWTWRQPWTDTRAKGWIPCIQCHDTRKTIGLHGIKMGRDMYKYEWNVLIYAIYYHSSSLHGTPTWPTLSRISDRHMPRSSHFLLGIWFLFNWKKMPRHASPNTVWKSRMMIRVYLKMKWKKWRNYNAQDGIMYVIVNQGRNHHSYYSHYRCTD